MKALKDWLPEFSRQKTVWGPMSKPQVGLSQPTALVLGVNNQIGRKTLLLTKSEAKTPEFYANTEPVLRTLLLTKSEAKTPEFDTS